MERTILIIDDDINIRKMLGMLIRKGCLGKIVCELDSGEHATEEIIFYNPDIVLIDLLLPYNDGIEVIIKAKSLGYEGKFIMISQVEDEEIISRAYENGILFFISKPINNIEVINVIRGVVYNIDLEKSLAQIKNAIFGIDKIKNSIATPNLDEKITGIFKDLGIIGAVGSNDLRKVINRIIEHKKRNSLSPYQLQGIYEEVAFQEDGSEAVMITKKTLEQRIRRTIQKAFETIVELGSEDYSNPIFVEYSTILFDFKQIRQQMRHIENADCEEQGKINIKKFIEGIIAKLE
jgi:two-component system, response regulator YcbB